MLHTCDDVFPGAAMPQIRMRCAQYFAHGFGISQQFIIRISIGLQHCDENVIGVHMIYDPTFS